MYHHVYCFFTILIFFFVPTQLRVKLFLKRGNLPHLYLDASVVRIHSYGSHTFLLLYDSSTIVWYTLHRSLHLYTCCKLSCNCRKVVGHCVRAISHHLVGPFYGNPCIKELKSCCRYFEFLSVTHTTFTYHLWFFFLNMHLLFFLLLNVIIWNWICKMLQLNSVLIITSLYVPT